MSEIINNKHRIAVIVSHPIQHFVPQYKSWSELNNVDLCVFFASKHGLNTYHDKNFGREIKWEGMQLDFPHEFLPNAETKKTGKNIDSSELCDRLDVFKPEIIISYGYIQPLQRRGINWAKKHNVSVCMISDSELHVKRSLLKRIIKKILIPIIYKKVDLFFSVGDSNEAYYRNYGVKDEQLIRTFFPIDRKHYDEVLNNYESVRNKIRKLLNIPNDHKLILTVGKLVNWKRQIDLVKLSNLLQNSNNKITIVLAGTGPDEEYLRSQCKNIGPGGVIFAGFVQPKTLAEYYCASDVYVHASEYEPHSLAISEALYCGKPIVISDRCGSYGPSDDLQNGLNGFMYRVKNIEDLNRKVSYIINNPNVEKQMNEKSFELSRKHQSLAHGEALNQAITVLKFK